MNSVFYLWGESCNWWWPPHCHVFSHRQYLHPHLSASLPFVLWISVFYAVSGNQSWAEPLEEHVVSHFSLDITDSLHSIARTHSRTLSPVISRFVFTTADTSLPSNFHLVPVKYLEDFTFTFHTWCKGKFVHAKICCTLQSPVSFINL